MKKEKGEVDSIIGSFVFLFVILVAVSVLFVAGSNKLEKNEILNLNFIKYDNNNCIFQESGTERIFRYDRSLEFECEKMNSSKVNVTYSYVKDLLGEGSFKILKFH